MGDELRQKYQGLDRDVLKTVLARRRCAVLLSSEKVARGWLEQHGTPVLQRPAAAAVSTAVSKRPAGVARAVLKRPAGTVSEGPAAKQPRVAVSAEEVPEAANQAAAPLRLVSSVEELERECGIRYRRE